MRAMILAAGRGQRMGELTNDVPKPLLKLGGVFLIEYSLYALAKIGVQDVVINICYRGAQIKAALGNGNRYGVAIHYSEETTALDTGGGIYQALPLLGTEPFIVLSCDVVTDYSLEKLPQQPVGLAHLVMVDNPSYHPQGDFSLTGQKVYCGNHSTVTFSNIGVYRPALFADCHPGKFRLGSLLRDAVLLNQVTGEYFQGVWYNLGSPKELASVTALPEVLL